MARGKEDSSLVTVLIIDDERMFAESLARLLADESDISVVGVASSGAEGIKIAEALQPRVVLVDYQLPDRDGVAVMVDLKLQDPETKVVMITGSGDDRVLLAAIEAGCSGFLTKTRAASEVATAVRAAAGGEALISPELLSRLLPRLNRSHRNLGDDLTDREIAVLRLLTMGLTNRAVATELHLSVNTIRNYVQSILNKLGAHSKLEAVSTAVRQGIVEYPGASTSK
jgi:DNA-binding NarL/FixJ family response regulator